MGKNIIIFTSLTALLVFSMYISRPIGIAEPVKLTAVNALFKIARFTARWLEEFEIMKNYEAQRESLAMVTRFANDYLSREFTNVTVTDAEFNGINVRMYEPKIREHDLLPALIFIHGGGWTTLSAEAYDDVAKDITDMIGQVVLVSIDYSLAPENFFPGPANECYTATKWLLKHADNYKIDAKRIGISGDSAGGNLAASVVLRLKSERITPTLKFQILIYPALQPIDMNLPSYQQNNYAFDGLLSASVMTYHWLLYAIGEAPANLTDAILYKQMLSKVRRSSHSRLTKYIHHSLLPEHCKTRGFDPDIEVKRAVKEIPDYILRILLHPYFAPLLADDLSGLPQAYILTGEFDVLRDDGILYAERLKEAMVKVTLNNIADGFHGMLSMAYETSGFEVGRRAKRDIATFAKMKFYPSGNK
ncbi:arylacetamide deacetylase-like [Saccoglossus kowalevskii]|uniref:Arylacetamide deacetylase-like n=1 Tax=Saccoglossus kowalevskii TaxID=10224 RepID=A0ABM0GSQ1_SACKO|nr:PREDICTED: arylacetamide deacetylase-like [Saccoglossus kowalevskii]